MAIGRQPEQQQPLLVLADALPKSDGHPFYRKLNELLAEAGFDCWIEAQCQPYYAMTMGRPSIPPGGFFRMMFVGFFEGIGSLRQIASRRSDSLAVREFLGLALTQRAPDDSSLTVIRQCFPVELFEEVFRFMILIAGKKKLLRGRQIAIDATDLDANAAKKSIIRREEGVSWRRYVKELAAKEGIEHASTEDARRFDRHRGDKKVSNQNWMSPSDPDSRIARMKDGRTHVAYMAEHAVDLESEIIVIMMRKLSGIGTPREWGASSKWLRSALQALLAILATVTSAVQRRTEYEVGRTNSRAAGCATSEAELVQSTAK